MSEPPTSANDAILLLVDALREKDRARLFASLRGRFCQGCGEREWPDLPRCGCEKAP